MFPKVISKKKTEYDVIVVNDRQIKVFDRTGEFFNVTEIIKQSLLEIADKEKIDKVVIISDPVPKIFNGNAYQGYDAKAYLYQNSRKEIPHKIVDIMKAPKDTNQTTLVFPNSYWILY